MLPEWSNLHTHILDLEQQGLVTRTFRRLDPHRQQAVLQAILEEAIEKGPASLLIKRVAQRAGVSVGSLYQYFGSRDHLLLFTVELCVRFMSDMIQASQAYLEDLPLAEALSVFLSGGIEWSQTQVGLVQFFGRAAYHGDPALVDTVVRPVARVILDVVRNLFIAAQKRGEIREDVDIEAAARLTNALLIAVSDAQLLPYLNAYFQVYSDDFAPERIFQAFVSLVQTGVSSR